MKFTITFQLDEESSQLAKTSLMQLSKRINDLTGGSEKKDSSFEEPTSIAPKPAAVSAKPAPKKKTKPRKSNLDVVLKTIKKHKDGINFKDLQKETGLTGKQISDNAYRLKKENKIKKTEKGLFVTL
jgi:predicted Rossmann fold nucleotide-binding protein DprA/Smf involved in DNA uptake